MASSPRVSSVWQRSHKRTRAGVVERTVALGMGAANMTIQPVKLIVAAHTGMGKSGLLASLVQAGYWLRVLDLDNGIDILRGYVTDPASPYVLANPACGANLQSVVTLAENRKTQGGKLGIAKAEVWSKACGQLEKWDDGELHFGSITEWTTQDVLVIDSFTRLGEAAIRFVQAMNGRLNQHPWQSDYGEAQTLLKNFLEIITSPDVQCNVVLNCHIDTIEDQNTKVSQDWPRTLGKALAPVVGSYFNTLLTIRRTGTGANVKRVLCTVPSGTLGVKNTAPFRVKPEYDIAQGLAEYFAAVRGT